jgi:broad specificity phosphatase PhoE
LLPFLPFAITDEAMSTPPPPSTPQGHNDAGNEEEAINKNKKTKKTVYLIRHAESEENRRLGSLKNAYSSVFRHWTLPAMSDLVATAELVNIPAQVDSSVSVVGQAQIENMADTLKRHNFVQASGIQLVVHSPLLRARETCFGMLQCRATTSAAAATTAATNSDPDANGNDDCINSEEMEQYALHASVQRVEELHLLTEKTPLEWIPGPYMREQFRARIAAFEEWLHEQPESVVAVVGHSQYFRSMLNLPYKFNNCDVWKVQFDYSSSAVEKDTTTTVTTRNDDTSATTAIHPPQQQAAAATTTTTIASSVSAATATKSSFFSNWMPTMTVQRGSEATCSLDNGEQQPGSSSSINNFNSEGGDAVSSSSLLPPQWSSLELVYKCNIASEKDDDDDAQAPSVEE